MKKKYISPTTYAHDLVVKYHLLYYSVNDPDDGGTSSYGDTTEP